MDECHAEANWAPMFDILEPAGIGKSVIMARLCELGHWSEDSFASPLHQKFERHGREIVTEIDTERIEAPLTAQARARIQGTSDTMIMNHALRSVVLQLAEKRAWIFQEVQDPLQKIESNSIDVPEVFRRLLAEPMRAFDAKLQEFAGLILIAFDSLDECVQN